MMFMIATLLPKYQISKELTRQIIHIGIANWWIIAMIFFKDVYIALIPPVSFVILNYLSYRYHLVSGIEREDKHELGTIYYPISLILLVIFSFGYLHLPYLGAIGVMIMGYGDGITTIIGYQYGKKKIYKNKTYLGSMTMFIISFLTTFILLWIFNPINLFLYSFIIATTATIAEVLSCKGLDNLTVPLFTTLVYYLLITI